MKFSTTLAFADAGVEEDKKGGSRRAIQCLWAVNKVVASASNDRCCHARPLVPETRPKFWNLSSQRWHVQTHHRYV